MAAETFLLVTTAGFPVTVLASNAYGLRGTLVESGIMVS